MKATIAGQRFNTDKAVLIGRHIHIPLTLLEAADWSSWEAALYATPHGSYWFLAGKGGRMTIFAAKGPRGLEYGERIIPLTLLEAAEFAGRYLGRGSPAVEALIERVARAKAIASGTEELKAKYHAGQFPTS